MRSAASAVKKSNMDAERLPEWVFVDMDLRLSWQETISLSRWLLKGRTNDPFLESQEEHLQEGVEADL